jgi:hypothetical protein
MFSVWLTALSLLNLVRYAQSMPKLTSGALFNALSGILEVRFINNIVSVEDAARPVTRDSHCYHFGHSDGGGFRC